MADGIASRANAANKRQSRRERSRNSASKRAGQRPRTAWRISLLAAAGVVLSCSSSDEKATSDGLTSSTAERLTAPAPDCTPGSLGTSNYWFCGAAASFEEAKKSCGSVGMDLVSIDNAEENRFLEQTITVASFIGLNDQTTEGAWKGAAISGLPGAATPMGSRGIASRTRTGATASRCRQAATSRRKADTGTGSATTLRLGIPRERPVRAQACCSPASTRVLKTAS